MCYAECRAAYVRSMFLIIYFKSVTHEIDIERRQAGACEEVKKEKWKIMCLKWKLEEES